MTAHSPDLPQRLAEAYRTTSYRFRVNGRTVALGLDVPSPELKALYGELDVESAAYLTAWNPLSQKLDDGENARRNAALRADIESLGLQALEGEGVGADGWTEKSFLAPGMTREAAKELANRYAQIAFVFAGNDAVPRLVFC